LNALPFFFVESFPDEIVQLNEANSKHVVQVLRMKEGDTLNLTDGKGNLYTASIKKADKKKCLVGIISKETVPAVERRVSIGISLLKNSNRFEWFLEKAAEIGISEIIPLVCKRTEKQSFRHDRMQQILISAVIQSRQSWLPLLREPVKFKSFIDSFQDVNVYKQKFIAHCIPQEKRNLSDLLNSNLSSQIILIGPEGDFTPEEIDTALQHHFVPVSLGETRLRTETAAMVSAVLLKLSK
jgi:16S rRNA (uracil1498-N3)-methyltransferase